MKVVLAAPYGKDTGGIARWTEHIINYYSSKKPTDVDLCVLSTGRTGINIPNISSSKRIYKGVMAYAQIIKKEWSLLKGSRCDIFHMTSSASYGLYKDIIMLKIAKHFGAKTITHFRFGRIPELKEQNNWEWKMIKKVISNSDEVIVLDEKSCRVLINEGFDNIHKVPNPISPKVIQIAEKYGNVERKKSDVLFVGHCYKDKGVFELVKACSQISGIRLIIVGSISDEMKQSLKDVAKSDELLTIEGEKPYEDIIKLMLECSVLVLPSYTEGFPNVILEAMACGCPIVATDVGAIPEMLDVGNDNNIGLCIKPREVEPLKEAIERMVNDQTFAAQCGSNAKQRVKSLYSIDSVWNQYYNIWKEA